MRFIALVISGLFLGIVTLFAQVITTVPEVPIATQSVSIRFDTSQEPGDLNGYTGKLYAHTGLSFSDGSAWQYVIGDWGNNTNQPQFQYIGFNTFNLTLSPDLYAYYGAPTDKEITGINIVIRSEDATKQTQDYEIDVFSEGLNINVISPEKKSTVIELNESVEINAAASNADTIMLFQNGSFLSGSSGNSISHTFIGDSYGDHEIVLLASNEAEETRDTLYIFVRSEPTVEALPDGMHDGINYLSDTSVLLSLYAPNKDYVFARGDFSSWLEGERFYMKNTPDGNRWWIQIDGLVPGKEYAYQYLVDGELHIGDPYADKVLDQWNDPWISEATYPGLKPFPEGASGIATVFQTAQEPYSWDIEDFSAPEKENLVIYELLVRDFIAAHDWLTLSDTLNYLVDLGINAIELMPFNEFEGNESWGYNPSYHFAPDKYYGPKESLKAFIDTCHQLGLAVIMDIVLNHAMGQCPLAQLYFDWNAGEWGQPTAENPWFNQISPNPVYFWGSDFNHESQDTKDFIDRVNKYWLTEYKVDGFRFDFTKGFTNTPGEGWAYDAARINILKRMSDVIWQTNSDAYVILEHFTDNNEEIELSNYGMMIWGNANHNYNQATMGYSSESDFSWGVSYRKRFWNNPVLVGYMESHDEERLMFKNLTYGKASGNYDTKDLSTALRRMEMAAAFFFTVPGPKMIWQFEELGYDYSINEGCRVCNKPIRWDYLDEPDRQKLHGTYAALINLKLSEPAFTTTDYSLYTSNLNKIIALNHPDMDVRVIGNFDVVEKPMIVSFSQNGTWYDFFSGSEIEITNKQGQFMLKPGEYHIYTTKKLEVPDIPLPVSDRFARDSDVSVYPVPAREQLNINHIGGASSITVYDVGGKLVRKLPVNGDSYTLSLEGIDQGIYLLRIDYVGRSSDNLRFVKQ